MYGRQNQNSYSIFKGGVWTGTYTRQFKDHALNLQLEFRSGKENKIDGAGTCDELGFVSVNGTYQDSTPVITLTIIN